MPLRCMSDDGELRSYLLDAANWADLKKSHKQHSLSMLCCGEKAIPKTSKLGTFFFSHLRKGECTSAPESKEHLLAKSIVAKAALAAGWDVTTECAGKSPAGQEWIADVLVEKGQVRIAIEIQWSRQADERTDERQEIYKESGVRGLWLLRQREFVSNKELPAFRLTYDDECSDFSVSIPRYAEPQFGRSDCDYDWTQKIPLFDFISGALSRQLVWSPGHDLDVPVEVSAAWVDCWKCGKKTRNILGLTLCFSHVLQGHPDGELSIYDFDDCPDLLQQALKSVDLRKHSVGALKKRASKTAGERYLSNGCVYCDALQGRFFDHESAYDAEPIATGSLFVDEAVIEKLDIRDAVDLWHFSQ